MPTLSTGHEGEDRAMSGPSTGPIRIVAFTTLHQAALAFDQLAQGLGHRLVGIVTTPGPPSRRSTNYVDVVRTARPDLDIIVTSHPRRLARMLAPLRPDLILCASFPLRIPADVLALPRFGAINGHPSLLPKYRGANPVGWALRNGDQELGFTVHYMDTGLDTGPILSQGTVPIGDEDTAESLLAALGHLAFSLYPQAIARALAGDPGEAQDGSLASDAPLFDPGDREIDWGRPAREVHNLVRGWHGLTDIPHGAFADLDGDRVLVTHTRLVGRSEERATAPGTVIERDVSDGSVVVQCGDGPLRVLTYRSVAATR